MSTEIEADRRYADDLAALHQVRDLRVTSAEAIVERVVREIEDDTDDHYTYVALWKVAEEVGEDATAALLSAWYDDLDANEILRVAAEQAGVTVAA